MSTTSAEEPSGPTGAGAPTGTALAELYGLHPSSIRPSISEYLGLLWQRRHFTVTFARSKVRNQLSGSRLGQLWQVLTPLANAGVYYLIFGLLLQVSRGVDNYIPFLITGVFIFTYTQRTVSAGARSISDNLALVRALHFPRARLPLAAVLAELQQLLVSMALLGVIVLLTGEPLSVTWLLLIPVLMLMTIFNVGLGLLIARIGAFVSDITHLLPFILRVWLYSSGVIFSIPYLINNRLNAAHENVPEWIGYILMSNPASVYIELSRGALMNNYPLADHMVWPLWMTWLLAIGWALVAVIAGFLAFWAAEEKYGRG